LRWRVLDVTHGGHKQRIMIRQLVFEDDVQNDSLCAAYGTHRASDGVDASTIDLRRRIGNLP
jgi:hypothetical protein